MRLGFWNRLAIVVAVLALIFAPLAYMVEINNQIADGREATGNLCRASAEMLDTVEKRSAANEACWKAQFPTPDPLRAGWGQWREGFITTLQVCAILYALIWLVVATAKWVWRGRRVPE